MLGRLSQTLLLLPLVAVLGCAPKLMPTPNLYASGTKPLFVELAPDLETSILDIMYATDRARNENEDAGPRYGHGRSTSVAFGSVKVEIGRDLAWDQVVRHSVAGSPPLRRPRLHVRSIEERLRFPSTPYELRLVTPGEAELSPSAIAAHDAAVHAAHADLSARLARTPRKEVFMFVHGVNTSFETAAMQTAEGWHFLGREGVPVLYTWPAKSGSALSYAYDRESGEFTIFHLKQTLRTLADMPEVEKIHVVAHSRGTDVASTALRELALEARADGRVPRERLKIDNLVVIAADLDIGVVMQRMVAEALGSAVGRITAYGYSSDKAMLAANTLFRSKLRVGEIASGELADEEREMLQSITNLDIVSYDGRVGGAFGHFYFLENPAISSDVLAVLRFGLPPGAGVRKGLEPVERGSNFWTIDDAYLRGTAGAADVPGR